MTDDASFAVWPPLFIGVAGFIFGSIWYGLWGKIWQKAANMTDTKMSLAPMIGALIAQIWMAACLLYFTPLYTDTPENITHMLQLGFGLWAAFILPTMLVNYHFQEKPRALFLIDGGHWLGVILIQSIVISLIS